MLRTDSLHESDVRPPYLQYLYIPTEGDLPRNLTPAGSTALCGGPSSAVGDALGAPYEFGSAPIGPDGPQMIGGGLGGFAPASGPTTRRWRGASSTSLRRALT